MNLMIMFLSTAAGITIGFINLSAFTLFTMQPSPPLSPPRSSRSPAASLRRALSSMRRKPPAPPPRSCSPSARASAVFKCAKAADVMKMPTGKKAVFRVLGVFSRNVANKLF